MYLYNYIYIYINQESANGSEVLRVLVGNKCDKEREIPCSIAEKFADVNNFDLFMETSALNPDSVERLFYDIAEMLAIRRSNQNTVPSVTYVDPHNDKTKSCCNIV